MATIFQSPYSGVRIIQAQGALISYGVATVSGSSASDTAKTFAGTKGGSYNALPMGVQAVQIQIARPASAAYSINTDDKGNATKFVYQGATQGSLQLQGIYGPGVSLAKFITEVSDPCAVVRFKIAPMSSSCTDQASDTILVFGCTLDALQYTLAVDQQGIAQISMPLTFGLTGVKMGNKNK